MAGGEERREQNYSPIKILPRTRTPERDSDAEPAQLPMKKPHQYRGKKGVDGFSMVDIGQGPLGAAREPAYQVLKRIKQIE